VSALRAAWSAGPLLLALWVVELVIAASAGGSVRAMARVAMQEFAAPPDGRILYAVAELGEMDPSLRAGMGAAILASVAIGLCVWTIAAPLVIVWIQRPREEIVARRARALGPSVAITLWHLALRIAILLAIAVSVGPLPRGVAVALVVLAVAICGAALDVARVEVVAFGAPGTSVRTALSAFGTVLRRPRMLVPLVGLHLVQWGLAGIVLAITLRTAGGIPWAGRVVALVGVACAAVRWGVALRIGAGRAEAGARVA
jgi:hypothetical protein